MSFLNQLKTQANTLQSARQEQDANLEQRRAQTEGAARTVLAYLQDLARQLNVIQPPAPAFTLDGKTPWPAMKLQDFRVDARRKMLGRDECYDYIAMGWQIVPQVGKPVGGVVSVNFPPDLQRVESRLAAGGIKHERKEIRHPEKNALQAIRFEYLTEARGSVLVTVEHEKAQLAFRLVNTSGFEVVNAPWPAARINQGTLDELAKRIVSQPSQFA